MRVSWPFARHVTKLGYHINHGVFLTECDFQAPQGSFAPSLLLPQVTSKEKSERYVSGSFRSMGNLMQSYSTRHWTEYYQE